MTVPECYYRGDELSPDRFTSKGARLLHTDKGSHFENGEGGFRVSNPGQTVNVSWNDLPLMEYSRSDLPSEA